MSTLVRWLKFNAVGIAGVVVQIWFLHLFLNARVNYLFATALAVEAALLHNFAWHQRYTWADRGCDDVLAVLVRLGRFHVSNGMVSMLGNVALMRVLVGHMRVPPVLANLMAIMVCSCINYLLGDRFVFRRGRNLDKEPGLRSHDAPNPEPHQCSLPDKRLKLSGFGGNIRQF